VIYRYKISCLLLLISFNIISSKDLCAEDTTNWFYVDIDTNYLQDLSHRLTIRLYTSEKFSAFSIMDFNIDEKLQYNPNRSLILGAGFSYGILTINIGVNFAGINNKDVDIHGKTRYLDLQTHLYTRKFVIDLYFQQYQGFYLQNSYDMITDWPSADVYQIRDDIKVHGYGANVQYIFNNKKFSYRAPYTQSDWQKKSAGSFLVGAESYFVVSKGDSSLIPENIKHSFFWQGIRFDHSKNFYIGINGGYAHTFVIKQKFFTSISVVPGLAIGKSTLSYSTSNQSDISSFSVNASLMWRFAIGYSNSSFFAGFSYVNLRLRNQAPPEEAWLNNDAGIIRFTVANRFKLKKPIKFLEPWKYYF